MTETSEQERLEKALAAIPPAALDYGEWCQIGMALKHEGLPLSCWDAWSAQDDARYHPGECARKWQGFDSDPFRRVAAGTLYYIAKRFGYRPKGRKGQGADRALGWDEAIPAAPAAPVTEPAAWQPSQDLITYLETLFSPQDLVGYCTRALEKKERGKQKYIPASAGSLKPCGQLIHELRAHPESVAFAVGDYNEAAGGWIRFNPLDGKGFADKNVTDHRYALIECDELPLEEQRARIEALRLPVAALVASGGKSLHAIVRIDAGTNAEAYRTRVNHLYDICARSGLPLDRQNRNPSRLSRMPGLLRSGKKQFLLATNLGEKDYDAWTAWYQEQHDGLPDLETLASVPFDRLPPLAPELIGGILRKGHKLLLSGPSKAGKSFLLIELTIAIANGRPFLGAPCQKGTALYVNFELDRASCLHRFRAVYDALHLPPENLENIALWNLRGKSLDLEKLAPKLIRRAKAIRPAAILLDPIYKVITGDENSAQEMALFCNQFDKIAAEVGCSVIYCHHHSKGAQGGKKAMDRASGSGVFARDPDALLDIIELPMKHPQRAHVRSRLVCRAIRAALDKSAPGWEAAPIDPESEAQLLTYAETRLSQKAWETLQAAIQDAADRASRVTAWRIAATLREFPTPPEKDLFFHYPLHTLDQSGILRGIRPDIDLFGRTLHQSEKSDPRAKAAREEEERKKLEDAYTLLAGRKAPDPDGTVRVRLSDLVEHAEELFQRTYTSKGLRKKLLKSGAFTIENSILHPVSPAETDKRTEA